MMTTSHHSWRECQERMPDLRHLAVTMLLTKMYTHQHLHRHSMTPRPGDQYKFMTFMPVFDVDEYD